MTLPSQQSLRLVDYFATCGLDFTSGLEPDNLARDVHCSPLERSYKGRVLEHFPNSVPSNPFDQNAICMLCLPHGLQFRTQKNLIKPKFHSFIITREDGSRYYGFSLIFFEEVRNIKISNAMQDLQAMHLTELSSAGKSPVHNSRSLPRHFKLSTPQPRSAQNYYDSAKDTLYVSKSIALICQSPYVVICELFLRKLQRYAMTKPTTGQLSVESYVYNFLYDVPIPRPGRSIMVQLVNEGSMVIQRPITIEELPLLDFSLELLFSLLTLEHIIQLYTCILLENQVLISSSDYQKLMLVAECMCSLLFPFSWQHVYVPILPASLQHFLDAPVPFIMGLPAQESQEVPIASEADLCYLNIDTGIMQIPEERPSFPRRREFCQKLENILTRFNVAQKIESQHNNDLMSSSVVVPGRHLEPLRRKHSWSHEADEMKDTIQVPAFFGDGDISMKQEDIKSEERDEVAVYLKQLTFNNVVRETFLNNFVCIFSDYHQFVIMPKEDEREEWFKNRETMANFDKATFLSDQPQQDLPFLSQFLETQMFASFIDTKILGQGSEMDHNLRVFEKRIKNSRRRYTTTDGADPCDTAIKETQWLIEKRLSDIKEYVPLPQEVLATPSDHFRLKKTPKTFPSLDINVFTNLPDRRPRQGNANGSTTASRRARRSGGSSERSSRSALQSAKTGLPHSPARIAQANWNFVETLLKDCKSKTNRMVVEKMGAEGVMLGEKLGNIEENTLIASFCDHLEKVWSHGMQQKQGKSALWSHLVRFKEGSDEVPSDGVDLSLTVSPAIAWCALRKRIDYLSSLAQDLDIPTRSSEPSPCTTPDSRSLERRGSGRMLGDYPSLKPLPVSVAFDVRNIEAMTEIKSEIGFSRAWIRLSLEKKLLSKHLQSLLSDSVLLKAQYKRNAFLRCEEEREQFLFHLLSLNAVDYYCFTNTYQSAKLPYRVMIVPYKRTHVSSTTANAWITVSGTHCETTQIAVPKGSLDFVFNHKNLGMLTTLRIGHDNSGIAPNWFVDAVIVRCEVTSHTFRFPCGRYLGRRFEDGSTERLLVGERIKAQNLDEGEVFTSPRSPVASRRQPQRSIAELQHMIGDAVNNLVKLFYRGSQTKSHGALTPLLCGEMGLVDSLHHAFMYGFKTSRFFGRNFYLWDYFLKVKESYEHGHHSRDAGSLDRRNHNRVSNNNYCNEGSYENQRDQQGTIANRSDSLQSKWRANPDGQIPRANRAVSCERRPNYLSLPRGRDGSVNRKNEESDSKTNIMSRYCQLVGKIENSSRAVGKDGKYQQFICLALRERILHNMLHPLAASRPTLEMYEKQSFLRDASLRTFLVEILGSLSEFDFSLEASITSGID